MDFGRAITYITEDERWLNKLGIGSLIMLAATVFFVPIFWLVGYQIAIMRNVMAGKERPLPEWDDWGKLFMDGLMVTIAMLVYTAPIWLIMCLGMTVVFLPVLGAGSEEVMGILAAMTVLVWFAIICFGMLVTIGLMFISPAVYIQYAITGDLKACFRFGEVFAIARDNVVNILITIAANIGANILLQTAASILVATLCGIVLAIPLGVVGMVWIMAMLAHFYGQIAANVNGGLKSNFI